MHSQHQVTWTPIGSFTADLPDPNPDLLGIIRNWMRKRGQDLPAHWEMSRPDERYARFCAEVHQQAPHTPLEFRTHESYRALIAEIGEQFQLFLRAGFAIAVWRGEREPYRDSQEMRADVRLNHRLFVYQTSGFSPDHPLAPMALPGWSWNDVFRAVHDLVGHAATGFQFGPMGEENAFRFQAITHSAAVIPALTAEIRLQNCWVNFGPHLRDARGKLIQPGEPGWIPPSRRPYAAQKAFSPVAAAIDCGLWRRFLSR